MLRLILVALFSVALLGGVGCDDKKKPDEKKKEKDEGGTKM